MVESAQHYGGYAVMKRFVVTIIMLVLAFSTVTMAVDKKRGPKRPPKKKPTPQQKAQQQKAKKKLAPQKNAQKKNPQDEMRKKMMGLEFWKKEMACQKQEAELNRAKTLMCFETKATETELTRKYRMMEFDIQEREIEVAHGHLELELHQAEVNQRIDDGDFEEDDEDEDGDDDDWGDRRRCGGKGCPVASKKGCCGGGGLIFMAIIICHLLCGVWVYKDIKARNLGSGIWIALAFIAGLFGTLVYAVVRIGDSKE
jgi:hypothetical protein